MTKIKGALYEDLFMTISSSGLLRMRTVSDKTCTEDLNTHFMSKYFFPQKSCRLWDGVKKVVEPHRPQLTI
jgi:hypothetical protein